MYDLKNDPDEMDNLFDDAGYTALQKALTDMINARPARLWTNYRYMRPKVDNHERDKIKIGPEDDLDIRDRLAFQITTLGNAISQWGSRTYLSKCGVTMTEWRVLVVLETIGPRTARKICELTKMDKGNVSRAVTKLINDKRISETPDPGDRRAVILKLTQKGRNKYLEVRRFSDERERRLSAAVWAERSCNV